MNTQEPKTTGHTNNDLATILLAPTYDIAKDVDAAITVEAEYGNFCKEGSLATLAHHGPRSNNPAPCNWPDVSVVTEKDTILISHIDLDTIGGVMAAIGHKPEDDAFWQAAEFIDVNGPQHIHELPDREQDKLNAFFAWSETNLPNIRYQELTNVSDIVTSAVQVVETILDERNPKHDACLQAGKTWNENATKAVEACLISDSNPQIRVFDASNDGPFCAAGYYSPTEQRSKLATVTLTSANSIMIAFFDGGKTANAKDIVQSLWGPEAGGHPGIAGSPRGVVMTRNDLRQAAEAVGRAIHEPFLAKDWPDEKKKSFDDLMKEVCERAKASAKNSVDKEQMREKPGHGGLDAI